MSDWSCGSPDCFRRGFFLVCNGSKPSGDFNLDNLVGGRIDLVCRVIGNTFFVSHGLRKNCSTTITISNDDLSRNVHLDGTKLRHLRPDERNTAALLKRALGGERPTDRIVNDYMKREGIPPEKRAEAIASLVAKSGRCLSGITVSEGSIGKGFMLEVGTFPNPPTVILLDEDAPNIGQLLTAKTIDVSNSSFGGILLVLGDDAGLTTENMTEIIASCKAASLPVVSASLGPTPLLASQCVTISNYLLDFHHICLPSIKSCRSDKKKEQIATKAENISKRMKTFSTTSKD
eukprot:TRINITY_DN4259_c0_g1_i1.p1 TRINITY_DN4259_c0_g1~~TRINITY_DN4259_c0_g1_i1.p1  ORF type:complete len:290 (+),score=41.21 TRINITY_DN4259_c0_g1_i1:141-1010(+)